MVNLSERKVFSLKTTDMERWRGRVAVVTGASAGIGAAIVYQLQDAGVDVVALARRKEQISGAVEAARRDAKGRKVQTYQALTPGKLFCVKCDVSKEEDIVSAFKWIEQNTSGLDILVNNAGVVRITSLTETNAADWKTILDVNVLGLSICTREAVQHMRERGVDDGHIVHIGSIVGHGHPVPPQYSMYTASKHAVRVLTEGLRKELNAAKSKIRITEVSPGLVKTDILDNLKLDQSQFWSQPYVHSEDIASAVLYALSVPPHVQIHEMIVQPVGQQ